jgi:1,4-alpha-glucan branching enzyme
MPHLHEDVARRHLGLKYHRITGRDVPQQMKRPYIPDLAREQAAEDAGHFIGERIKQAYKLRETFEGHPPLVVSPYDAELFGHWWYEGPQFVDFFFRKLHFDQADIQPITPGDFLDTGLPLQVQRPSASSWGEKGYYKVWLNSKNSWLYPYQHDAERRMTDLATDHARLPGDDIRARVLNQMARELLLAQSSDWAFQIYQGTTVEYSSRRFESHIYRFDLLAAMLANDTASPQKDQLDLLTEIEGRDNIFPEIDFRIYSASN